MTTSLHAQPYDQDARGFYFSTFEEYEEKQQALRNSHGQPVEEFEIQYIDGDDAQLFTACGINQSNLAEWFDDIETLDDHEKVALFFLMDDGIVSSLSEGLEKADEVSISECRLEDAAAELFDDCYAHEVPESIRGYIDYAAFARDCQLNGDMVEFEFKGTTYTCTNASGI